MQCVNCGTELKPGENLCPKCGSLNMAFQAPTPENPGVSVPTNTDMEILDDLDSPESAPVVQENMAPPTLSVENTGVSSTQVQDISSASNVSTYAPGEPVEEEKTPEQIVADNPAYDNVNIALPSVKAPVQNESLPTDGTAPTVDVVSTIQPGIETSPSAEAQENPNIEAKQEITKDIKIGKKKLTIKTGKPVPQLIVIIIGIVALIIGVLCGKTFFSTTVYSNAQVQTNNTSNRITDGKNNTTSVNSYTYKIPDAYYYDKRDGGLYIYDKDSSWRIFIRTDSGLYDDLVTAKTSIRESLKSNGVTVNNIKETKIQEKNYLIIESTTKIKNRLIAFTNANNDNVFFIEIVDLNNSQNYDALDVADDIIQNTVYEENNVEIEKTEINDISELVIVASQAYKSLNVN